MKKYIFQNKKILNTLFEWGKKKEYEKLVREIFDILLLDNKFSIKKRDEKSFSYIYDRHELSNSHIFLIIFNNFFDYNHRLNILKCYKELTFPFLEKLSNNDIEKDFENYFNFILNVLKLELPKIDINLIHYSNISIIVKNLIGKKIIKLFF
jgi:hypothetical protein